MLSPSSAITLSTVRIVSKYPTGIGSGTGALFNFNILVNHGKQQVPAIITNKHVVVNSLELNVVFTQVDKSDNEAMTDNLVTKTAQQTAIAIPSSLNFIINHPNPAIDLCAILIGPFINNLIGDRPLRHYFLDESWLPDEELKQIMRPIEPIVMIGYPNGLWDATNNLPLVRGGRTASHPLLAWNGKPEFVIDAACFPGSSGSPVFLYEDGMYRSSSESYSPGTRVCLLGFLYEGPIVTVEGKLVQRAIPTGVQDVPVMNSMMNLGNVIEIEQINHIKTEIARRL